MARLPKPGSDKDVWGKILNDYLSVAHQPDGTIKPEVLNAAQGPQGPTGDPGPKGDKGDKGDQGDKGDDGQGVPLGGASGQLLAKKSSTDFDTEWLNRYSLLSGLASTVTYVWDDSQGGYVLANGATALLSDAAKIFKGPSDQDPASHGFALNTGDEWLKWD